MDKKIGIIIGVLVVAVLVLIGVAFVADSNDSSILTINDVSYGKEDFENYYKVRYFEESETAKNSEDAEEVNKDELKTTAFNEYTTYMIIAQEAKSKGYALSQEKIDSIAAEYDAEEFDRDALTALGVSKEDYIAARKVVEAYNDFIDRVDEFYDVPQSTIDLYMETNKDLLKGYDFRVMQFNITSTESETNEDGEEVPATSDKEEVTTKAQDILERVKAGEDFETLAKENANERFVLTNSELKQVNGELESVDLPYLSSYLMFSCSELADPIKALENVGDYTELLVTDNYAAFARLEAVRDDVEAETREALEKEVAKSVGTSYISSIIQSSSVITNNRLLKSIEI
ncbi:MAG: SurA N-terminal domain-containing protein [Clostridia bacterium]|nr:SurA N-terminal domain-containing protein [Clostridia bacterium]